MTEAPAVLDAAALAELRQLDPDGSQRLLPRLTEAFERSFDRLLPELDAALAAGPDLDRVARVAHTCKSACGNLAALQMAARWRQLEQQCKEGRHEGIEAMALALRADLAVLLEALRTIE